MCIGFLQTIAIVFLCIIYTCKVEGRTQTIDLESNVCESRQSVTDQDVYNIIANPRTDLPSGRDHCNVFFTADPPIRKFYIYIKKIQIQDCGVSIKVYDGDPALKNHRWSISCKGPPAWKLLTWYGNIVIRLEKYSSSSSNNYNIDIVVTTDQGPIIDTGTSGSDMEGISTGAIIGIAVACGLAVIIIVGFILFCTCRMFKDKDDKHPPSTVFSTATSRLEHGFLKPDSSRASSTGHRVEFLGIGANEGRSVSSRQSTAGSFRTRSSKSYATSKSYDNSAYSRSEDESSVDVLDGKVSSSQRMHTKKLDHIESAKEAPGRGTVDRQSYRKKEETKNLNSKQKEETLQSETLKSKSEGKQSVRTNGDRRNNGEQRKIDAKRSKYDDERTKSYSKSKHYEDEREKSRGHTDTKRVERSENNTKSRLYEPDRKYHSDNGDRDRRKANRRESSRSHDSKRRSKYDKEYHSNTSQTSTECREEDIRSSRRRYRDGDDDDRYRDRSENRGHRHSSTRERSRSMSKYDRERDRDRYYESDRPKRSRSKSETRSRSKSEHNSHHYRDRDRDRDYHYDDRSRHRDQPSHRQHSEHRYDDGSRSQRSRSRSQRDSYRRPNR